MVGCAYHEELEQLLGDDGVQVGRALGSCLVGSVCGETLLRVLLALLRALVDVIGVVPTGTQQALGSLLPLALHIHPKGKRRAVSPALSES